MTRTNGLLSLVLCQACATQPVPSAPAVPPAAQVVAHAPVGSEFDRALASARSVRDRARSQTPPGYSGDGTTGATVRFLNQELKSWIERVRPEVNRAVSAYGEAFAVATNDEQRIQAYSEIAELRSWFVQQFTETALSSVPVEIRANRLLIRSFMGAIEDATRDERRAASVAAERCVALHTRSGSKSRPAEVATCDEVLRHFPPQPKADAPARIESKTKPPWDRPVLESTQSAPCVFRGSFSTRALLYAGETGPRTLAALDGQSSVEVEQLVLADRPSGRAKVVLSWPLAVTAWLDADVRPLTLGRRVDIVANHVWVAPGFRVNATTVRDGSAEARAPFSELNAKGSRPEPGNFVERLSCGDLVLANGWVSPPKHRGSWKQLKPGAIELFDRPHGRRVAKLVGSGGAYVGEEQAGWVPIAGNHPFVFEGWTRAANMTSEGGPLEMMTLGTAGWPPNVVVSALPVRVAAVDPASPVGQLQPGAPIRLGKVIGGFVEVTSLHAVGGAPKDARRFLDANGNVSELPPFYALVADVERSAKATSAASQ